MFAHISLIQYPPLHVLERPLGYSQFHDTLAPVASDTALPLRASAFGLDITALPDSSPKLFELATHIAEGEPTNLRVLHWTRRGCSVLARKDPAKLEFILKHSAHDWIE
eukprot:GABV01013586.1.p1 GENE.GABV01013586.1~~GABV01013586.1.p1  ORF type:complete len:109 (-),score=10.95 GABV01013586.1:26-352(-)